MKEKLRIIVEDNTTKAGKLFDSFIQILIVLSLLSFSIETLPDNTKLVKKLLGQFEIICVVIFSVEYVLRVIVAKQPLKYILSFYGVFDLLAILPFYLRPALDLRSLRAFRLFRIFRTLKLARYNMALKRFHKAFKIIKEELVLFLFLTTILIFLSSAGIYYFENSAQPELFSSIFSSLWWAIVTLTTVGYGDVYPITVGGRVFTFFVLLVGVGVVTIPAGLVASALSKARNKESDIT